MALRYSPWGAAVAHQCPTMCHTCLPCSCCCHCHLLLLHHKCNSRNQLEATVPVNQQTNLPRQASVSSIRLHSATAVSRTAVMMLRSRCNKVSVSSSRQRQRLRTVLAPGPVDCTMLRVVARCDCGLAFAKEVHDVSVKSTMFSRMAMRTQHLTNVSK